MESPKHSPFNNNYPDKDRLHYIWRVTVPKSNLNTWQVGGDAFHEE